MKKYAVIDIGSNTVRMVVYAVEENDTFHALFSKKYTLGLAGYVQDGVMSQEGIHRLCGVLIECRMLLSQFEMERSFVFATASLRNIQNTREAADQIFLMTGFSVDVISGQAEAYLDYYGVMVEAPLENGLLFDIGGGSTELVTMAHDGPGVIESLPIGSLTLAKEYVGKVFPKQSECEKIQARIRKELKKRKLHRLPAHTSLCGVGGTAPAGTGTAGTAGHPAASDSGTAEKAGKAALEKRQHRTGTAAEKLPRPAAYHLCRHADSGRVGGTFAV